MKKVKNVEVEVVNVEVVNVEVKTLGRKINPNSTRQLRLKELEVKRANGELRKGRPIV